jgi:tetratricopeptide (TPR) repeat protein
MNSPSATPSPAEVQQLLQAFHANAADEVGRLARRMLARHPGAVVAHSVLASQLARQGSAEEALPHFAEAARLQPASPELQCNLGLCLASLGRHAEAAAAYRRAVKCRPDFSAAHFNLGCALQSQQRWADAAASYRRAAELQPDYVEAWGNLGVALQQQGALEPAIAAYRKALKIRPHPRLYLSLGSALRNLGELAAAVDAYRQALTLDPDYAQAHDQLGSALWARGEPDAALACYQQALAIQPGLTEAHYHMGVFLQDAGRHAEAIGHFDSAGSHADAAQRALYCQYRSGAFAEFRGSLPPQLALPHRAPLVATLTAHHARNFGVADPYAFCPQPLSFIYHVALPELQDPGSTLLADLLVDITHTAISERKQGRLHAGIQSAGNLFRRSEPSFRRLAELVLEQVRRYPAAFADLPADLARCELLRAFPTAAEFSSSWYIRMRQGGHLTSHIHEEGWISGCVYLAMPPTPPGALEGSIEFSTHGDDYPCLHDDFPQRTITPGVGDIVLFPSSLFHRTIPFAADEDRICVAFDIRPSGV